MNLMIKIGSIVKRSLATFESVKICAKFFENTHHANCVKYIWLNIC